MKAEWVANTFTSSFWSWWIIFFTVAGIFFCFWLIWWTGKGGAPKGETAETMGHVWDENLEELNNPLPRWWLNMFYITLAFGIIYLILYPGLGSWAGVLGWTDTKQYEEEMKAAEAKYGPIFAQYAQKDLKELAKDPEALKIGRRLFLNYCAICHGSDARGAPGFPNLTDNDWLYGGKPETIEKSILDGRQGTMPPMGAAVGGEEGAEQVAHYVRSLSGLKHDAAKAEAGKAKFAVCAGCHGPDGKGNQTIGAPNLTDKTWLYGSSVATIKKTIMQGRHGKMPAHRQFLGEDKVHLLAAYVYSLSHQSGAN
ncbi:MAG TPA: cytochrome-c oxidase, cbb3-type subunit III [Chromatiales bacterium]|nr:cytochrome-c oxidase, cbb3-type subunit III [Chromatiales bacterium]